MLLALLVGAGCSSNPGPDRVASPSTTTTERPALPEYPVRLANDVDLQRQYHFFPPRPTDTTRLRASEFASAGAMPFPGSGKAVVGPIVALARYTDDLAKLSPHGGYTFDHQLVVVVFAYGPRYPDTGAAAATGPTGTSVTPVSDHGSTGPIRPSNATVVWTFDPVTGHALIGGSFPGRLPAIKTTPSTR